MYKEIRTKGEGSIMAESSPETWAKNFAQSRGFGWYENISFSVDKRWKLIRRHLPKGARVLDAGCGLGEWVEFLNRRGYQGEA